MNILISGAGIAGLTLAHWLQSAGHNCTIMEKAPNIRTEGYMIDFGGSGWDVANMMGLIPALKTREHHVNLINFMNDKGKVNATIDTHKLYKVADVDGKFMALNRRDIVLTLYEHIQAHISIHFGMTIQDIQQYTDHAHVTFSDGTSDDYDLVVGADGIHSHVRRMVFGEEKQFSRYLGYQFAIFTIPAQANIPYGFDMYHEPNVQVSVYPIEDEQWLVFVTHKSDESTPPAHQDRCTYLKTKLQGMGWICPIIASAMPDNLYIFYDTITQIINPSWSKGRVVLIGDAAHCPTLVSGQGASMAMAGAYFLAQALQEYDTLESALIVYDDRLRPHIEHIQDKARNFAPNFVPSSIWKIRLIEGMIRLVDLPIVKNVVGKQFAVNSIIPPEATRSS